MSDKPTSTLRELRTYIEYWKINHTNTYDQRHSAKFLAKYGGLDLYGDNVKKIYTIDNEDIQFFRKSQGIGCTY